VFSELAAAQQIAGEQAPWDYPKTDASDDACGSSFPRRSATPPAVVRIFEDVRAEPSA
jgi:hypothetical protein